MNTNGFMRYRYPDVLGKEHYVQRYLERMGIALVIDTCSKQVIPSRKLLAWINRGVGMHTTESVIEETERWEPKTDEDMMEKKDFQKLFARIGLRDCVECRDGFMKREREALRPLLPQIGKFRVRHLFEANQKRIYRVIHGSMDTLTRVFYSKNRNNPREAYVDASAIVLREFFENDDWMQNLTDWKRDAIKGMKMKYREDFDQEGLEGLKRLYADAAEECIVSLGDALADMGVNDDDIQAFIGSKGDFWRNTIRRNIKKAMEMYMEIICHMMEHEISRGQKESRAYQGPVSFVCKYFSGFGNDMDVVGLAHYLAPYRPFVGIVSEDSDVAQMNHIRNIVKQAGIL